MCALPARRIASSAFCAALLVGITGPAAMAADSAREHSHVASPEGRIPGADARLALVKKMGGELTPVAHLLKAVLEEDDGQLSPAKARKLGAAAKAALAKAAAKAPAEGVVSLPAPARPAVEFRTSEPSADETSDALDAWEEALDTLLEAITSGVDTEVLPSVDDLLTEVDSLLDGLLDIGPALLPELTDTSASTSVSSEQTLTIDGNTVSTTVLRPAL
ncbi:hypothetical protein [Streptomyces sp. NL15-2K]|uniref:hypothetical protein n=1 Tax=Streptomyces sp. NL15-2K TaxID=376149 RepID=UPI000FFB0461|nr:MULTISPECIES: hypothetical protein [Actinomycetes]WKX09238.1 hypothetical protein Q4V64_17760 [Kutzneria buriramensis]GCB49278.1 hypothetical protein SNL152K_6612 [Streptomyces sp. NL15-2K]